VRKGKRREERGERREFVSRRDAEAQRGDTSM